MNKITIIPEPVSKTNSVYFTYIWKNKFDRDRFAKYLTIIADHIPKSAKRFTVIYHPKNGTQEATSVKSLAQIYNIMDQIIPEHISLFRRILLFFKRKKKTIETV